MTFARKYSGDRTKPIVATYTCPEHGGFDAEVQRNENGEAPDVAECQVPDDCWGCGGQNCTSCEVCCGKCVAPCHRESPWTPSSTVGCRVRRVEVVRGRWEKPERKTYLDTRKLGEGQDIEEFQAERKKIWNDERHRKVKELLR